MTFQRKELGRKGEDMAAAYLKRCGYDIIERNFVNKLGELDIIAKDHNVLCFIEVKTRRTLAFGSPFESITKRKQHKIIRVAESYLQYKNFYDVSIRFDCMAVYVQEEGEDQIELIKGAFEA
ncbi:hypothetical protein MNBD_UNCLBAC01-1193 [hydrothermal vent metagenome]|uniref:Uncharacterized protein n=1 Tax=hydrothermal vent metagenome TaxID=652676 RepID=A0A3B1DF33_9ZZZZ